MNQRDLESWAIRAAQELQELIDDAEDAVPHAERPTVLQSARVLVSEFDDIFHGRPVWQSQVRAYPGEDTLPDLFADDGE